MKTLWFKQIYVEEILSGRKADTIRKRSSRLPAVGDEIALTVGPRPPFAHARVTGIKDVKKLSKARRAAVTELYGDDADMVQIDFMLVSPG